MKSYNKLVRDKIPGIISAEGKSCDIRILTDADYLIALEKKLDEELAEYHLSGSVEELADLLEVIYAISIQKGCPPQHLDDIRMKKAEERGRFDKKFMLLCVEED